MFSSGIGLLFVIAGILNGLDLMVVKVVLVSSLIILLIHVINTVSKSAEKENHHNT